MVFKGINVNTSMCIGTIVWGFFSNSIITNSVLDAKRNADIYKDSDKSDPIERETRENLLWPGGGGVGGVVHLFKGGHGSACTLWFAWA